MDEMTFIRAALIWLLMMVLYFEWIKETSEGKSVGKRSKRSRACEIPPQVKEIVGARDFGRCIICKRPGYPNAHYIARSHGGLGIEENVVTLCPECHMAFDNGQKRREYGEKIRGYLKSRYPNWNEEDLKYDKWRKQ